jgi:hypothetical protein
MNSHTPPPAFDWRAYEPLARAAVTKLLKGQDPGRFERDELLSAAVERLATCPGSNYAKKAIKGALVDFARDHDKVVNNVELTEKKYLATAAELDDCLPTGRAAKPKPCDIPSDNALVEAWRNRHSVTVGPPPRRVRRRVRHPITGKMFEILPSRIATSTGYKVSSKHNKVPVSIGRATYNDEWSQEHGGGWKRAKIEDDEQRFDPDARMALPRSEVGQADYTAPGRERRFSVACLNGGEDHRAGMNLDELSHLPSPAAEFLRPSGHRGRRQFRFEELGANLLHDGVVTVTNPNPPLPVICRKKVEAPKLTAIRSGKRTSDVIVDPTKFGLEPVPKDKLGAWRDELAGEASTCVDEDTGQREPTLSAPSWHRDARGFRGLNWGLLKMRNENGPWTREPGLKKPPAKTEAELIVTVANIQDAAGSLLFAQRARKAGMAALAVACEERAKELKARAKKGHAGAKTNRGDAIDVGEQDDPSSFWLLLRLPSGGSFGGRSYFLCPRQ